MGVGQFGTADRAWEKYDLRSRAVAEATPHWGTGVGHGCDRVVCVAMFLDVSHTEGHVCPLQGLFYSRPFNAVLVADVAGASLASR